MLLAQCPPQFGCSVFRAYRLSIVALVIAVVAAAASKTDSASVSTATAGLTAQSRCAVSSVDAVVGCRDEPDAWVNAGVNAVAGCGDCVHM